MARFVSGEVVVLPYPFTDFSSTKVRPALVLAVLDRGDIILCQITSQPGSHAQAVPVKMTDFVPGGSLPLDSYALPRGASPAGEAAGSPRACVRGDSWPSGRDLTDGVRVPAVMNSAAPIQTQDDTVALQPPLPVRRLHNYIYCQRLFYYQWVENLFEENADTSAGSHLHRNVDKPRNYDEDWKAALVEGMPEGRRQVHPSQMLRRMECQHSLVGCDRAGSYTSNWMPSSMTCRGGRSK